MPPDPVGVAVRPPPTHRWLTGHSLGLWGGWQATPDPASHLQPLGWLTGHPIGQGSGRRTTLGLREAAPTTLVDLGWLPASHPRPTRVAASGHPRWPQGGRQATPGLRGASAASPGLGMATQPPQMAMGVVGEPP